VYTPTLKKHQVVRDLKKFENHWSRAWILTLTFADNDHHSVFATVVVLMKYGKVYFAIILIMGVGRTFFRGKQ